MSSTTLNQSSQDQSNDLSSSTNKLISTQSIANALPIVFSLILLSIPLIVSNQKLIDDWNNAKHALFFTSHQFLFLFVPTALLIFFITRKYLGEKFVIPIMICISLTFYASWGIKFVPILVGSITFNFIMREFLRSQDSFWVKHKKIILAITITLNLLFLGIFKYADFFIQSINQITGLQIKALQLFLPFGISFFTFQEITLAVDTYRGAYRGGFLKYILFVSFFPHLVAGPLVHHREMMPQFTKFRLSAYNLNIGIGLLTIGLFKKIVIADSLSPWVKTVFDADLSQTPMLLSAWTGALAYAFQIYFDFSGYSDMALGLARLFGVRLPINFNAPYRTKNIIDFWRSWHITLSRFLREYLYFPLGGNRAGTFRRYINLFIVMLLGGLWHGASWTFVIWGGLHALFLVINHGWQALRNCFRFIPHMPLFLARILTFVSVVIAWVPFRATDFDHTKAVWFGMFGLYGSDWKTPELSRTDFITALDSLKIPPNCEIIGLLLILFALYIFCLTLPSSQQIMRLNQAAPLHKYPEPRPQFLRWRPTAKWAVLMGLLFGAAILAGRNSVSEFLYWSF